MPQQVWWWVSNDHLGRYLDGYTCKMQKKNAKNVLWPSIHIIIARDCNDHVHVLDRYHGGWTSSWGMSVCIGLCTKILLRMFPVTESCGYMVVSGKKSISLFSNTFLPSWNAALIIQLTPRKCESDGVSEDVWKHDWDGVQVSIFRMIARYTE